MEELLKTFQTVETTVETNEEPVEETTEEAKPENNEGSENN